MDFNKKSYQTPHTCTAANKKACAVHAAGTRKIPYPGFVAIRGENNAAATQAACCSSTQINTCGEFWDAWSIIGAAGDPTHAEDCVAGRKHDATRNAVCSATAADGDVASCTFFLLNTVTGFLTKM